MVRTPLLTAVVALFMLGAGLPQANAAGYDCAFTSGQTWSYRTGAFGAEQSKPLSFRIVDIDAAKQSARLEAGEARSTLRLVEAIDAWHFIEVTVGGFMNVTTIYDVDGGEAMPAVHSRHIGIIGKPLVAQYRGACRPDEG